MNRVFIGIQAVNGREFAVDELGGGHAAGVLEAQQGRVVRIEIDGDVLMLVQRTRHVAQQRATDQSGGTDGRILRRPGEAGTGQTETVGGAHDDLVALELDADAGEHRTVLLTGDRDGRLVDGLSEGGGVHLTQFRRHHGQIRIFAFRHELHGEGRLARRDGHRGTIGGKIGFRSGQRLGDVGKQFAQHQNATGLVHAGFDMVACGNGVVEGGKLECAVNGFQTDARQNRGCGTCVDDTCGPCHGIGKSLGIDFDFHGVFLVSFDPHAILAIRATTTKAWGIPRITRLTMKVRKTYFRNNKPCG